MKKLSAYLVKDVTDLKNYLQAKPEVRGKEIARLAWDWFHDFIRENAVLGLKVEDMDGSDPKKGKLNIDNIPDWVFSMYWTTVDKTDSLNKVLTTGVNPIPPAQWPTFLLVDYVRLVKNEWLVHFTKNPRLILRSGFTKGVSDITRLGLTTHLEKTGPGFNFAYLASEAPSKEAEATSQYGGQAVMFRASGVRTFHKGAEEEQTIFLGSTAKDIVQLSNTETGWQVLDNNLTPVFKSNKTGSEGLKRCVDWVEKNFDQYKNKMTVEKKPMNTEARQKVAASLRAAADLILSSADKALFEVRTNFPEADMWVTRKGTLEKVGSVTRAFSPENIGVKVLATDVVLPDYLYYVLMHLHTKGFFKNRAKGTTNLQNITVKDVNDALSLLRPAQVQATTNKLKAAELQVPDQAPAEPEDESEDKVKAWNKLGLRAANFAFSKMKATEEQLELANRAFAGVLRDRNSVKAMEKEEIVALESFLVTMYSDHLLWSAAEAYSAQASKIEGEGVDKESAARHLHQWLVETVATIAGLLYGQHKKTDMKAATEFQTKWHAKLRKTKME